MSFNIGAESRHSSSLECERTQTMKRSFCCVLDKEIADVWNTAIRSRQRSIAEWKVLNQSGVHVASHLSVINIRTHTCDGTHSLYRLKFHMLFHSNCCDTHKINDKQTKSFVFDAAHERKRRMLVTFYRNCKPE